jgi:hypothetical protein
MIFAAIDPDTVNERRAARAQKFKSPTRRFKLEKSAAKAVAFRALRGAAEAVP